MHIPDICQFRYTIALLKPVKSTQKSAGIRKKWPNFAFYSSICQKNAGWKKSTPPPVVAVVTNVSYMSKDLSRRCENYAPTTQTLVVNSSSTAIQGFSIILSNSSFASPLLDSYDAICVQFSPTGASTPSSTSIGPGGYISR